MTRDVTIGITTSALPADEARTFTDVQVGRHRLAALLGTDLVGALDADAAYARQLLGEEPAAFPDGRVPLYVCTECGDLDCGALTVAVEHDDDAVVWRDFAVQSLATPEVRTTTPLLDRAGPFRFERAAYTAALAPFTARGRRR